MMPFNADIGYISLVWAMCELKMANTATQNEHYIILCVCVSWVECMFLTPIFNFTRSASVNQSCQRNGARKQRRRRLHQNSLCVYVCASTGPIGSKFLCWTTFERQFDVNNCHSRSLNEDQTVCLLACLLTSFFYSAIAWTWTIESQAYYTRSSLLDCSKCVLWNIYLYISKSAFYQFGKRSLELLTSFFYRSFVRI